LFLNGAFNIQFDEKEKDSNVKGDIYFLLRNRKRLKLPKWFVSRIKSINKGSEFFAATRIKQKILDRRIIKSVSIIGFTDFCQELLHYLDDIAWGKYIFFSESDRKKSRDSSDIETVAAVSYLIRRADEFSDLKIGHFNKCWKFNIRKLIIQTRIYLYR
jgi:hypothetical protein